MRRTTLLLLGSLAWAPLPALAGSQSSDSSSGCSDGRCWRIDRLTLEDDRGRHGWVRQEQWRERDGRGRRGRDDDRDWRGGPYHGQPWGWQPRRGREDDDDDD